MTRQGDRGLVFVVDDDAGVRRMISRMVCSVGLRAETYASVQEFLDLYDRDETSCLVLDVRMPGLSGLDLQEHLAAIGAPLPIIFITGHGDVSMGVRAMKRGAADFIEKPFQDQVLLDAIHAALVRAAELRTATAARDDARNRLMTLTPRERQVLTLVVAGKLNKQIAAELGTAEQTIKMHRGRLMRKMGADSLPARVRLAQLASVTNELPG